MAMLVFSDLHLREENAELVLQTVLPGLVKLAKAQGCFDIGCLGDFWQVRHTIPVWLLNRVRDMLRDCVEREEITWRLLSGNHDQVDVDGRNALESLAGPGIEVYSGLAQDAYGIWVPYRKEKAQQLELIRRAAAVPGAAERVLFGHFGVVGAQVAGLGEMADGIQLSELSGFWRVLLGHYHRPQTVVGRTPEKVFPVEYIGSPYQVNASEANESKHVLLIEAKGDRSERVPVRFGARYWQLYAETGRQLQENVQMLGVEKGDIVHLEVCEGAHLGDMATVLHAFGVERHTISHRVKAAAPRLQVQPSTPAGPTLEDYFCALAQLRSGEDAVLTTPRLVGEFRSIQMEAAK